MTKLFLAVTHYGSLGMIVCFIRLETLLVSSSTYLENDRLQHCRHVERVTEEQSTVL